MTMAAITVIVIAITTIEAGAARRRSEVPGPRGREALIAQ
jgi:hypothetical protein